MLAYQREVEYVIPAVNRKPDATEEDDAAFEELERVRAEEQERINTAEPLTEEELTEKEELVKNGFENWHRRDYYAFIRGNEKFGRKDLEGITTEVEGKTLEEVTAYAKVFWERYQEISGIYNFFNMLDYQRTIAKIEEGEAKLDKLNEVQQVLHRRVTSLTAPLHQLKINYGQIKGKSYSEEEDRFLVFF